MQVGTNYWVVASWWPHGLRFVAADNSSGNEFTDDFAKAKLFDDLDEAIKDADERHKCFAVDVDLGEQRE